MPKKRRGPRGVVAVARLSTVQRVWRDVMRTPATQLTRERLLRLMLPSAAMIARGVWPQPANAAVGSGVEEIRKAASLIPGYGPPDIAYPAVFRGRWQAQSRVVDVKAPLGEEAAPTEQIAAARQLMAAEQPLVYDVRFLDTEAVIIADRAFNAERRAASLPGAAPLQDISARWDPTNPNVLTVACRGSLVETKVTKRSFEAPFDGAFGTSEYARIADAGSAGVISAVPQIMAERVQTR